MQGLGATQAKQRELRAERAMEVQALLAAGESVQQIATRLGSTVVNLSAQMYRAKRPDLGRPFTREISRARRAAEVLAREARQRARRAR